MKGIDLNKDVIYEYASFRYFEKNEHHVERLCESDVLLLVFDGILRFSEDGIPYEVHPGNYHIQKKNSYQKGEVLSDSPKYLFVHFTAEWTEEDSALPFQGSFEYQSLRRLLETLDKFSHNNYTQIERSAVFYEILSKLYRKEKEITVASQIAEYISQNYKNRITLEMLSREFHFSKNHIINIFKEEYNTTPLAYINDYRLTKAEYLLEVTSKTAECISKESGFRDYPYFYKLFYRRNLLSPVEWRKKKRIQPCFTEKAGNEYTNFSVGKTDFKNR